MDFNTESFRRGRRAIIVGIVVLLVIFLFALRPVSGNKEAKVFEIKRGDGFFGIVHGLKSAGIIRSSTALEIYAVLTGAARHLKPGIYELAESSSTPAIVSLLRNGPQEISVRIPDGASVGDVDTILSEARVLPAGSLFAFASTSADNIPTFSRMLEYSIEGRLYPDTYSFLQYSTVEDVVAAFLKNFDAKAAPFLNEDPKHFGKNLILASLVQKEVADQNDARIIAGILEKRLAAGVALNVDATICYLKKEQGIQNCYPFAPSDFKIKSPYNTYLYPGLPPGPIGSPEASAIQAVLDPVASPYWFYLSDPKTGKTIFAKTLEEQNINRAKYLR